MTDFNGPVGTILGLGTVIGRSVTATATEMRQSFLDDDAKTAYDRAVAVTV